VILFHDLLSPISRHTVCSVVAVRP